LRSLLTCSPANGYFNAYGNAARKDKHDYVVHLGDYLYEGAQAGKRAHNPPRAIFSLWDYRTRHGQVGDSEFSALIYYNKGG
jgi:phosphodiesterase/alkaline phosphatase D-like protein